MQANAIEALVAWMDAMRRGDLDAAADCDSLPARGAEAVELIAPSADTVVLGAKVPGLTEVGGDYALRDEALQYAAATAPAWR